MSNENPTVAANKVRNATNTVSHSHYYLLNTHRALPRGRISQHLAGLSRALGDNSCPRYPLDDQTLATFAGTNVPLPAAVAPPSVQCASSSSNWPKQVRHEPRQTLIEAKIEADLTAQRIYQDLVAEQGFAGAYNSVKRFVRRLPIRHEGCTRPTSQQPETTTPT